MKYTKMHGAGNGFVLLDNTDLLLDPDGYAPLAVELCGKESVDGMIVVAPAQDADCGMVFYNRDGSLGEMCGNGARCLARYAVEHGLADDPDNIRIRTAAGLVSARRIDDELYEVRLNDPSVVDLHRFVPVSEKTFDCFYTELGDPGIPHAVVFLKGPLPAERTALRETGRVLRFSPQFPRGANVTFAFQSGPDRVEAITYERGVEDFTLACGTGCGATAAALVLLGRTSSDTVHITMPGGKLSVTLRRSGDSVTDLYLTGPTAITGEGGFV